MVSGEVWGGEPSPAWGGLLRHAEGSPEMGAFNGIFVESGMSGKRRSREPLWMRRPLSGVVVPTR